MNTIHPGWTKQPRKTAATRTCEWCKRPFDHGNSRRMFCGEADCDRERDKERKREIVRLRKMFQEADAKRKKYDGMAKAQITEVKRAFREARSLN